MKLVRDFLFFFKYLETIFLRELALLLISFMTMTFLKSLEKIECKFYLISSCKKKT